MLTSCYQQFYENFNSNMFQFTVRATDSGRPPRSTNVEVTIFIVRAQLPVFINTPYATQVQENAANNSQIYTVTARDQDGQVRSF